MLSSYIIEKNNLQFKVLIIDKKIYPLTDIKTQKNLDSFITFYIVEITLQVYDKKLEEKRYIMLQANTQNIKEVDISNELFIQKTINEMYLEYNRKKEQILDFI